MNKLIGRSFRGWDGKTYKCTGYRYSEGFDMVQTDAPAGTQPRKTNISERAIGRTFHEIVSVKPSQQDAIQAALKVWVAAKIDDKRSNDALHKTLVENGELKESDVMYAFVHTDEGQQYVIVENLTTGDVTTFGIYK